MIQFGSASLTVGANFQVVNDTFNFDEDAAQQTLNVLNIDTATSGTTLTIVEVSTPSRGGTLTIANDGKSLNYRPAANVNGAETFTYTVANASNIRQTGTVTVQLTDINDPPVATADTFTVVQDSTQNVLDVLANDTRGVDPSTETLTVSQVGTGSAGGTISVGTSGLNVRYTPRAGFTGTETFTYTLSDGRGGTATATATVTTVNPSVPAPTATADSFPITEDAAEASFDVINNDTPSVTGDTLTLESVGSSSKGSTVSVGSDGKMKYKPAANFAGTENITYVIRQSNGGRATGTVTFTVSNVNDAPVATADTLTAVSTSTTSTLNVLSNDTDPDTGDTMTITTITQPPTGSGTLAISSDSKSVIYTPPSSTFEGNFSFSYTIRDTAGLTSTATASVKVESFTPRAIKGKVMLNGTQRLANINLTLSGTTSSGTAVNQTVSSGTDGSFTFNSLAPGNYTLKRDPLPFLNDRGAQVAITSDKTDGDFTNDLNISGSLLSQHIDVRDFLGSSFMKSLTAVLKSNGTAQWVAPQGDWADLTSLSFQVNTSNLTINAARTSASNLTATVPFTNGLMSKATSGDFQLFRLRGASTAFNLAAPTTPSNNSTNSGSNTPSGEGEGTTSPNGSSTLRAEGEGSAAPAVANNSSSNNSSSNFTSNGSGSVLQALLGSNSKLTGPTQSNNGSTHSGSSNSNTTSVDEAMKDVGSGLKTSVSNPLLSLLASARSRRN